MKSIASKNSVHFLNNVAIVTGNEVQIKGRSKKWYRITSSLDDFNTLKIWNEAKEENKTITLSDIVEIRVGK